eukprot:g6216.t1
MWSDHLTLKHISFVHSASWTLHPQYSSNILVEDVEILNPRYTANTDGFDPDSCVNVVLRDSLIDTGDDGISIKSSNSSRDKRVQMPSRNIHIFNTTILSRNVCIGSATYGGIYDILVEDCVIGDANGSSPWAIKYKSHRYYPGAMVNHTFRRLSVGKIAPNSYQQPDGGTAFIITLDYGKKRRDPPPPCPTMCPLFQDIHFEDITVLGAAKPGFISGEPNDFLKGLHFKNVSFVEKPKKDCDAMSDEDDDNIKLFDDMEQVGRFKGRGHRYTRPSWNDMEHDMEQVGRFKGRGHRYTRPSWNDMEHDMEQVGRFKGRGHRYTRPSWNDMEHDMEQVGRFKGRGHRYTRPSWNDMEHDMEQVGRFKPVLHYY